VAVSGAGAGGSRNSADLLNRQEPACSGPSEETSGLVFFLSVGGLILLADGGWEGIPS